MAILNHACIQTHYRLPEPLAQRQAGALVLLDLVSQYPLPSLRPITPNLDEFGGNQRPDRGGAHSQRWWKTHWLYGQMANLPPFCHAILCFEFFIADQGARLFPDHSAINPRTTDLSWTLQQLYCHRHSTSAAASSDNAIIPAATGCDHAAQIIVLKTAVRFLPCFNSLIKLGAHGTF